MIMMTLLFETYIPHACLYIPQVYIEQNQEDISPD